MNSAQPRTTPEWPTSEIVCGDGWGLVAFSASRFQIPEALGFRCMAATENEAYIALCNQNQLVLLKSQSTVDEWKIVCSTALPECLAIEFLSIERQHGSSGRVPLAGPYNAISDVTFVAVTANGTFAIGYLNPFLQWHRKDIKLPLTDSPTSPFTNASLNMNADGSIGILVHNLQGQILYYEYELRFTMSEDVVKPELRVLHSKVITKPLKDVRLLADRAIITIAADGELSLWQLEIGRQIGGDDSEGVPKEELKKLNLEGTWSWSEMRKSVARSDVPIVCISLRRKILGLAYQDGTCEIRKLPDLSVAQQLQIGEHNDCIVLSPRTTHIVCSSSGLQELAEPQVLPLTIYKDEEIIEKTLSLLLNNKNAIECAHLVKELDYERQRTILKILYKRTAEILLPAAGSQNPPSPSGPRGLPPSMMKEKWKSNGFQLLHPSGSPLASLVNPVLRRLFHLYLEMTRDDPDATINYANVMAILQIRNVEEMLVSSVTDSNALLQIVKRAETVEDWNKPPPFIVGFLDSVVLDDQGANVVAPLVAWVMDLCGMLIRHGFSYYLDANGDSKNDTEEGPEPTHLILLAHPVVRETLLRLLIISKLFRLYLNRKQDRQLLAVASRSGDNFNSLISFFQEIEATQEGESSSGMPSVKLEDEITMFVDGTIPSNLEFPQDSRKYAAAFSTIPTAALYSAFEEPSSWLNIYPRAKPRSSPSNALPSAISPTGLPLNLANGNSDAEGSQDSQIYDVACKTRLEKLAKRCLTCHSHTSLETDSDYTMRWHQRFERSCHCGGSWIRA